MVETEGRGHAGVDAEAALIDARVQQHIIQTKYITNTNTVLYIIHRIRVCVGKKTLYYLIIHAIRERQHVLGLDWPGLPEFHHPARHILL